MAVALVGTIGAASQGTAGNAVTPAWGASENRTAGNLLICFVSVTQTATLPTTPEGWSIAVQKAGTLSSVTIYHKVALGTDAAPQIGAITSGVIAAQLAESEEKIVQELIAVQGSPVDLGGYFRPNVDKATAAMRPSPTFNRILASL